MNAEEGGAERTEKPTDDGFLHQIVTALNTESIHLFFPLFFSFWLELFEPDLLLLNKSVITNSNAFRIFSQICYLPPPASPLTSRQPKSPLDL